MVTVLAARWQLGNELYRETGDVDLGVPPIVARDLNLVGRLKDLKYLQVAGNRFARGLSDIPAGMKKRELQRIPRRSSTSLSRRIQAGLVKTFRSGRISSPRRSPDCSWR